MDNPVIALDASLPARFLSLSQRIGRLRYFVYVLAGSVGASAAMFLLYLFCFVLPISMARMVFTIGWIIVGNIGLPMLFVVMLIRRLHDIDAKGWWSLAVLALYLASPLLVTLSSLVLMAVPGSPGVNRFGPPPRSNNSALKYIAIGLPLMLFAIFIVFKGKTPTSVRQLPTDMRPLGGGSINHSPLQTYPQH